MAITHRVPGPLTISVSKGGDSKSLGVTKQGATIYVETRWEPITCDALGSAPADFIFTGKSCRVEIIGLDTSTLKTALAEIMEDTWGEINEVGYLMSGEANDTAITNVKLTMVERGGAYTWEAEQCDILNTHDIILRSTQEFQLPLTFLVLPDSSGDLFQTLPSYIR